MSRRGRIFVYGLYAAGIACVGVGLRGALGDARNVPVAGWAKWLLGGVVIHDAVFVPVVLLASAALAWVPIPSSYRRIVQVAAVVGGSLTVVALPVLLGYGRRADNPSQLPQDYGRNLVVLWLIVLGCAVVACVVTAVRRGSLPGSLTRRRGGSRKQTCRTDSLRKAPRR